MQVNSINSMYGYDNNLTISNIVEIQNLYKKHNISMSGRYRLIAEYYAEKPNMTFYKWLENKLK